MINVDAVFRSRRSNVLARRGMVATSQPLAAQAGLQILMQGGNAADAAVATAAMLNVVEPISTGIGGDCFALYYDGRSRKVTALNGSGRSPASASIDAVNRLGYTRMPIFTGISVSIPGTVAGWSDILERHGRMTLGDVLKPAIWTAENGYPVSELIANAWMAQEKKFTEPGFAGPIWEATTLTVTIHHPNGEPSTFKAETSGPDSGRSFTANLVILDEWAFQQFAEEIWAASYPTINRPTGGQVIGLSTNKIGRAHV